MWRFQEDDFTRELFHFVELLAELFVVGNSLLKLCELLLRKCNRYRFFGDLARPLVAGTTTFSAGAVLDRTLTNVI